MDQYSQRNYDNRQQSQPRQGQETSRPPVQPPANDYKVRTFERDDLDIPSFLRRSRTNGR